MIELNHKETQMKFEILLSVLFELLAKRKVTASYLAKKHKISNRTVHRYVDILSLTVPIETARGRNGGIQIVTDYALPMGFMTEAEYTAALEALDLAYEQSGEEKFLAAKLKLTAQRIAETK